MSRQRWQHSSYILKERLLLAILPSNTTSFPTSPPPRISNYFCWCGKLGPGAPPKLLVHNSHLCAVFCNWTKAGILWGIFISQALIWLRWMGWSGIWRLEIIARAHFGISWGVPLHLSLRGRCASFINMLWHLSTATACCSSARSFLMPESGGWLDTRCPFWLKHIWAQLTTDSHLPKGKLHHSYKFTLIYLDLYSQIFQRYILGSPR